MATTTAKTIRNTVIGLIEDSAVPAIHSAARFRASREEMDFRPWAEKNPAACTRRVSVRFLGSTEPPAVNDTLVQEVRDTMEIIVAYANDWRFGGGQFGQLLGLDDVIADDARLIEKYVGPPGFSTFAGLVAPATVMWEQPNEREASGPVTFSILRYRVDYFRSLS